MPVDDAAAARRGGVFPDAAADCVAAGQRSLRETLAPCNWGWP